MVRTQPSELPAMDSIFNMFQCFGFDWIDISALGTVRHPLFSNLNRCIFEIAHLVGQNAHPVD